MVRVDDPSGCASTWAILGYPFITFAAVLGVGLRPCRRAPRGGDHGLVGFAPWAGTEAGQQTLTLFAFDKWRATYATADEVTRRNQSNQYRAVLDGLWDALLLLCCCLSAS